MSSRIAFFDTHEFEKEPFRLANVLPGHEITFLTTRLDVKTAALAKGFAVVCAFANDQLDAVCLEVLARGGTNLVALRSAGYNHVDLKAAAISKIRVVRVPEYSPYAIAEHVVALIQTLNRKTHKAYNRVREGNFSLDGLVGFDLHGKTIGIVGTGRIGKVLAKIMHGFGCSVLLNDIAPDAVFSAGLECQYVDLHTLLRASDIISLHLPLMPATQHCIGAFEFSLMKKGVMLINTSRGGIVDSKALIKALKAGQVGQVGLDVYEEEAGRFFEDQSDLVMSDDVLARLLSFSNVLITGHQGFLTREALTNIANTTLRNVTDAEEGRPLVNAVSAPFST